MITKLAFEMSIIVLSVLVFKLEIILSVITILGSLNFSTNFQ